MRAGTLRSVDSSALLKWLQGEPGGDVVKRIVTAGNRKTGSFRMSALAVGECAYKLARSGKVTVPMFLTELAALPIVVDPVEDAFVWRAAQLRAARRMPYVDAIIAATAEARGAVIVTADSDFAAVEDLVEIEWIG